MLFALAAIVLAGASRVGAVAWNASYPIDADAVVSGSTADTSVLKDLGPCTCDMTYSRCDAGCPCDPDCTAEEQALFSAILPDSSAKLNIKRCVDAVSVDVNPRAQLVYSLADNMLCVQDVNSPVEGVYFASPPSEISTTMFAAYRAMKPFTFESLSATPPAVPTTISYQTGLPIIAALSSPSGTMYPFQSGFLPIPRPGLTGFCNDHNFALFQQVNSSTCTRFVSDLSTSCSLELDASYWTSKLRIGKTATATPDVAASYATVSVSSVVYQNRSTGLRSSLGSIPSSSYDATSCTCRNAIKQISFSMRYDKSGQIVSSAADVVVSEVVPVAACSLSTSATIEQTYAVDFIRDWDPSDTGRGKSGNPGYLLGYPVLAGQSVIVSGKNAIQQYISGLTVFGPSSDCSNAGRLSVGFNESLISSCLVRLSATELQSACQAGKLFDYLKTDNPLYIGQWGSSSYIDPSTWIQLDQETPPSSFTWSSVSRSCSGIVDSINYEFVTATLGSISNPQSKILAARIRYGTSSWRMKTLTDTEKQSFELKSTVTFITMPDGGSTTVIPPAPPIFPRLPADVLYPLAI